jgi:uncharacterized repeat protein (TIGR01451 family)/uncharacterized delta-60 repeat protein
MRAFPSLGRVLLTTLLAIAAARAAAQVDPSFGTGGHAELDLGATERASGVVVMPDGSVVVAGRTSSSPTDGQLVLAAFEADGSLRTSFGTNGVVTQVYSHPVIDVVGLVRMPDGRLVVAGVLDDGSHSPWGSGTLSTHVFVARLQADGQPDASFSLDGLWIGDSGERAGALAVQADGAVLVGGSLANAPYYGDWRWMLRRLTVAGAEDPDFAANDFFRGIGRATYDVSKTHDESIEAIHVQADGRIVVAAGTAADDRLHLARYMPTGDLDASFGTGGVQTNYNSGTPVALAQQADGRYLVAGNSLVSTGPFSVITGNQDRRAFLQRYNADGTPDYSLRGECHPAYRPGSDSGCFSTVYHVRDLKLLPNGKFVVAGFTRRDLLDAYGNQLSTQTNPTVGVHNPDGTWDTSFGDAGVVEIQIDPGVSAGAEALALDGYARVYAAGHRATDLRLTALAGVPSQFTVGFKAARFEASEASGKATIGVRLGQPLGATITVDYATGGGTATEGSDYLPVSGTLTFAPGQTLQTFEVPLVNDAESEGDETVALTLSNLQGPALLGRPNPATLVIADNPGVGFSSWTPPVVATVEGAGFFRAYVSLPEDVELPHAPMTVEYSVSAGSATAGQDFTPISGLLTLSAFERYAYFDVPIHEDGVPEPEETLLLHLANPTNASLVPGRDTVTVRVADDAASCTSCPRYRTSERDAFLQVFESPLIGRVFDPTSGWQTTLAGPISIRAVSGNATLLSDFVIDLDGLTARYDLEYDPGELVALAAVAEAPVWPPVAVIEILDGSLVADTPPGSDAGCTLAHAIRAANLDAPVGGCVAGSGDDFIYVPAGVQTFTAVGDSFSVTGDPGALPRVSSPITIGGAGAELTVLERSSAPGTPEFSLFLATGGSLTLQDLTLRGGKAPQRGGAVMAWRIPLTLRRTLVEDSSAGSAGGAVYQVDSSVTVIDSELRHNSAGFAGGGIHMAQGIASVSRSRFVQNTASFGGGLYQTGYWGSTSVEDSDFVANAASSDGGGLYSSDNRTSVNVLRTQFRENRAGNGGGIYCASNATVTESTFERNLAGYGGAMSCHGAFSGSGNAFVANEAGAQGGALYSTNPSGALQNSTFSGNVAGGSGGAIACDGCPALGLRSLTIADNLTRAGAGGGLWLGHAALRLSSSIVTGNRNAGAADDIAGSSPLSEGYNLVGVPGALNMVASDHVGTASAPLDPLLGPLAVQGGRTATRALLDGSPALDAGSPEAPGSSVTACSATDQRGRPRPGRPGAQCDIGAYERDAAPGADVSIAKRVGTAIVHAGDPVTYRIDVTNNGALDATGVVVTDPLGPGMALVGTTATQGSCSTAGGIATCTLGTLAAGATTSIDVTVTLSGDGTLANAATVTADAGAGLPISGSSSSAVVNVQPPIVVDTTLPSPGGSGDCTLGEAIQAANTDAAVDACPAGRGQDLILLPAGTFLLGTVASDTGWGPNALPVVTAPVELRGAGRDLTFIERDPIGPAMRLLQAFDRLWLKDLSIVGGQSPTHGGAIRADSTTVTAERVTFDRNKAANDGGAFYGRGLRLLDSVFQANKANQGGAATSGSVVAERTSFVNNRAAYRGGALQGCPGFVTTVGSTFTGNWAGSEGGAISGGTCNGSSGWLRAEDSVFSNNEASLTNGNSAGGAIHTGGSPVEIRRSRFESNRAVSSGGAISSARHWIEDSAFTSNTALDGAAVDASGNLTVGGSTFSNNAASRVGGALRVWYGGRTTLSNVTLSGNRAAYRGGGVFVETALDLNNVTIAGNTAGDGGGAIFNHYTASATRFRNSVIAQNTTDSGSWPDLGSGQATFFSDGHNLIGNTKDAPFTPDASDVHGTQAAPLDPRLGPLQDNGGLTPTQALLPGSPALDAGNPAIPGSGGTACEATDQRGVARGAAAPCDMGAFESVITNEQADLALSVTFTPDPAVAGILSLYQLEIGNLGPTPATGINIVVELPGSTQVKGASVSQGTYTQPESRLLFHAGDLAPGASARLDLELVLGTLGPQAIIARGTAVESDPTPENGTATTALDVQPALDPGIARIAPSRGGEGGPVLVAVIGRGFSAGATVALMDGDTTIAVADHALSVDSSLEMLAFFDLRGRPLGQYDVQVTNPDGRVARMPRAFTIEPKKEPKLYVEIVGPESVRPGQTVVYQVVIGNGGNGDAFSIPFYLELPGFVGFVPRFSTLAVPRPDSIPADLEFDPAQAPQMILGSDGGGTPTVTYPYMIPSLRAGAKHTLSIAVTVPVGSSASSFKLRSYGRSPISTYRGTTALHASVADVLDRAARGPFASAEPAGDPAPGGCSFGLDLTPEGQACLTSVVSEMANAVSVALPPGLGGCVAGMGVRAVNQALLVCSPPTDGWSAMGMGSSMMAGMLGVAAGCFEKAAANWNPILNWFQLALGANDVFDKCQDLILEFDYARWVSIVRSADPNAKIGPAGVGDGRHFRAGSEPLRYAILFENKPEATAPAQEVVISDQLDTANLDLSTFSFGPVRFGETEVALPANQLAVSKDVDLRPSNNLIVRIQAALEPASGLLSWRFTSLDPQTGEPTTDATAGFLPPNVTGPEGDGSVVFFVDPKPGLPTGTAISNQARIVFDLNDPIDTDVWTNTIDNAAPVSQVESLAPEQTSSRFTVSWSGSDVGSGIRDYTVWVSRDGAPFTQWLSSTPLTSSVFAGEPGGSYAFYSVARDAAYNREEKAAQGETTTTVPPITLGLEHTQFVASEGDGAAVITVVRSGATGDEVSVQYETADINATPDQDYVPVSGTLVFAAGETAKTFSIPLLPDAQPESDEQVWITLSGATGGATILGGQATLTIRDDEPPVLSVPADLVAEAMGPTGAVVTYAASATSHIDGDIAVACTPGSGEVFPLGATTVSCTATDSRGGTASAHFSVTVVDTTAPVVTVPASMTVEATGATGAAVSFAASAADLVGGDLEAPCTPASGSTFALGTTAVMCAATDDAGNAGSASFSVTVVDTTAPVVTVPASMTVEATGATGAVVSFSASAADLVGGDLPVLCAPNPGSTFPLATTTVTCKATDGAGNAASAGFDVTVRDSTPPSVLCGSADGAWHADNISIACTAADIVGLSNAADAAFALFTAVPDGVETPDAATDSRAVCDAAGNCITVGPLGGNRIDRKAPSISFAAPAATTYPLGATVTSAYSCADAGSGVATCSGSVPSGSPVDTATAGLHSFTVSATDGVGNSGSSSVTYDVVEPSQAGLPGRMHGEGHVDADGLKHHFAFRIAERASGEERGALHYWFEETPTVGRKTRRAHRFEARSVTSVLFSDDPASRPGGRLETDTATFAGAGRWDGTDGFTYEARAVDAGEPGRGRDQLSVTVRDRDGRVVASFGGALSGGNIQSLRLRRQPRPEEREKELRGGHPRRD